MKCCYDYTVKDANHIFNVNFEDVDSSDYRLKYFTSSIVEFEDDDDIIHIKSDIISYSIMSEYDVNCIRNAFQNNPFSVSVNVLNQKGNNVEHHKYYSLTYAEHTFSGLDDGNGIAITKVHFQFKKNK